jgi:hypothetical protein
VIALLGSLVLAAATASPPPTIIRERVSPVCSTLHQLVLPLAEMNLKDKPIMDAIRVARSNLSKSRNTRLGDGAFLYASRLDTLHMAILQQLTDFDQLLIKSYAMYPQGTNSKVDALRQRVQNVVDLERVAINYSLATYAAMVDNDSVSGIENGLNTMVGERPDEHGTPPSLPTDIVPFATPAPSPNPLEPVQRATAPDTDRRLASSPPPAFAMRSLKWTRPPELQTLMQREGPALEAQALIAAHDCDGV